MLVNGTDGILREFGPQRLVQGLEVVVIAHQVVRRTRQAAQDLLEPRVGRGVLRRRQRPVTLQDVGARKIAAEDGKCGRRLQAPHGLDHPAQRGVGVELRIGAA